MFKNFFGKSSNYYYDENDNRISKDELEEIGSGGEGTVFKTKDDKILKLYFEERLTQELEEKIKLMVSRRISYSGICWPENMVFNHEGKFIGYIMCKAKGYELQKSVFMKPLLQKRFPDWTRVNLTNLAINILKKLDFLHENHVIVGDLNPFNILVNSEEEVYFVDTDSYQIGDYKCSVGTPIFTAPEIQGKNFGSFFRTINHEYFAIATLLFMIYLPGKTPYSFQGGEDVVDNIIKKNFSYPFDESANFLAPKGPWEFIWNELSYELKEAFYNTFKLDTRLSPKEWIKLLEGYKKELVNDNYEKHIFPDSTTKYVEDISVSMNRRNEGFGEIETVINESLRYDPNIAVIELSTKAVKMLIGDLEQIKTRGFNFKSFKREAKLTNTGKGLDAENNMDLEFFKAKVIPVIDHFKSALKAHRVDIVYTVATAAIRSAKNNKNILKLIKEECGLNVKVLTKEEEAKATLDAFMFSGKSYIEDTEQRFILIDQGGGSTEITLFEKGRILETYSLDLGTVVLENRLFVNNNIDTDIRRAFKEVDKQINNKLRYYFQKHAPNAEDATCISVGTVITRATGKATNKRQHGTKITLEYIENKIRETEDEIAIKYNSVGDVYEAIHGSTEKNENTAEDLAIMRMGLFMYKELMKRFNIKELLVSGTGLWYGVYYDKYKEIYECS
ncbi:hypothetical protein P8V03_09230 [Clostridium sp. A1-XYC3]|uniref:Protein kinase domain-containing protein n=1 Tax=Clostridium tanneri TaxID=3037988 RepID=A0ABU4JTR7_9CLOT|nr:hypothetical protein [Clostridium sp. A1-XYC3]MDW8801336.1 hypothetical protein [Clostridium sp. A1-XYC3]